MTYRRISLAFAVQTKGLGFLFCTAILYSDALLHGGDQIVNILEYAALHAIDRDTVEAARDRVEPGGRVGREVDIETRMFLPALLKW
jgi:hypothetical protein